MVTDQAPRTWVLLRGLARGTGHWGNFVELFRQQYPEDLVIAPDLAGNGTRFSEDSPLTIKAALNDIKKEILRLHPELSGGALKFNRTVNLVAISLGGMIGTEWMRQSPDEISKAFLMNTSAGNLSPFWNRFRLQNYPKILKSAAVKSPEFVERTIVGMVSNSEQRGQEVLPQFIAFSQKNPLQIHNVVRQLWAASRYKFPAKSPGNVSLIGSYGDRLVSPKCTLKIGKLWNLQPAMHPWGGHDLVIDDPEWVLSQIQAGISAVPAE